jgi:hypothetical protein
MPARSRTVIGKACKDLGLTLDFRPNTHISAIFSGITLADIISCLRTSPSENAQIICAFYDRLSTPAKNAIDIDYLIAAARISDPHAIAGLICENYSRVSTLQATFIAAKESPNVVRAMARKAKLKHGHNDGKLLLQISGVAPVPKNQVNFIGKIDNSRNAVQINNGVPTHHGIIGEVSEILRKLPSGDAPPPSHSPEDSSDRTG